MVEVALGSEGEITVAGDSVMVGYHKNIRATQEAIYMHDGRCVCMGVMGGGGIYVVITTPNTYTHIYTPIGTRYFRTGDLGTMVDTKFLKITGRIKELYKLSNGKFVMPAPLEDMLCRSNYIAQACVGGVNEPHNVAIIVPDFVEIRKWIQEQQKGHGKGENNDGLNSLEGLDAESESEEVIVSHPAVIQLLSSQVSAKCIIYASIYIVYLYEYVCIYI